MEKNSIQEQNNCELNKDYKSYKELTDAVIDNRIYKMMQFIENERKEKRKKDKSYSQAEIARKANICRATYINYSLGYSDDITVKALLDILLALQIHEFDIFNFQKTKR